MLVSGIMDEFLRSLSTAEKLTVGAEEPLVFTQGRTALVRVVRDRTKKHEAGTMLVNAANGVREFDAAHVACVYRIEHTAAGGRVAMKKRFAIYRLILRKFARAFAKCRQAVLVVVRPGAERVHWEALVAEAGLHPVGAGKWARTQRAKEVTVDETDDDDDVSGEDDDEDEDEDDEDDEDEDEDEDDDEDEDEDEDDDDDDDDDGSAGDGIGESDVDDELADDDCDDDCDDEEIVVGGGAQLVHRAPLIDYTDECAQAAANATTDFAAIEHRAIRMTVTLSASARQLVDEITGRK